MSEIFDFLKKTETHRRQQEQLAGKAPDLRGAEVFSSETRPEGESETAPSVPMEIQIWGSEKFDLTRASREIKNVLEPLTLVGEQFRLLRSRLGILQKQRGIRTILITSAVPEEGKTFIASGLVGIFAQEPGKRVLLIDADLRRPRSGWSFGLNGSSGNTGLSEVLREKQEFHAGLLMATNPEFYFMPSGPLPLNPSELLSSPMLEETIRRAAESFDWVIIDSPPVLPLSDATLISPLCDAVLLVVRGGRTPSKLVLDAINRIGRDKICGVILNRQKYVSSSRYYYQYYYRSSIPGKE